jgi:hypothetical protein
MSPPFLARFCCKSQQLLIFSQANNPKILF